MHAHRLDHNDHTHLHHHPDPKELGERGLFWAVIANMGLTIVQIAGGLFAGSLAVLADALHNFGDACILILALVALKIGQRPADKKRTFGYQRAESIAALISLTTLCVVGAFLIMEGIIRLFDPREVTGWLMISVTLIALAVDLWTAWLTSRGAKHSSNIKAAFLHNAMDALASLGVIVGGIFILLYGWFWVDALITILIASYAIYFALSFMRSTIHLLMNGTPVRVKIDDVVRKLETQEGVDNIHHIHMWRLNDKEDAFEAHVKIRDMSDMDRIKHDLKKILREEFNIGHSTLEFELEHCCD